MNKKKSYVFSKVTAFALSFVLTLTAPACFAPLSVLADTGQPVYTDIGDSYAKDAISEWSAPGVGILAGYGNGIFAPEDNIRAVDLDIIFDKLLGKEVRAWSVSPDLTREQAAAVIAKSLGIEPVDVNEITSGLYGDHASIAKEYQPYVYALKEAGIQQGDGTNYMPKAAFTRESIIQTLANAISVPIDKNTNAKTYKNSAVIRKSGITLRNAVIHGNLIIGHGVGDGEVTLDNVKVEGRLIVYGGGSNSIVIKGTSAINAVVVNNSGVGSEPVRLKAESNTTIGKCQIAEGGRAIISGVNILSLTVEANAEVTIAEGAVITLIEINGSDVIIHVEKDGVIEKLVINGNNATIEGEGTIKKIEGDSLDSANVSVAKPAPEKSTPTTTSSSGSDTSDSSSSSYSYESPAPTPAPFPEFPTPSEPTEPSEPSKPMEYTPSNPPVGGGSGSDPGNEPEYETIYVTTAAELQDALSNSSYGAKIIINADLDLFGVNLYIYNGRSVIIPEGITVLFDEGQIYVTDDDSSLTIDGSLLLNTTAYIYSSTTGGLLINGTLTGATEENNIFYRSQIQISGSGAVIEGNADLGWVVQKDSVNYITYSWLDGKWQATFLNFNEITSFDALKQIIADINDICAANQNCLSNINLSGDIIINEDITLPKWTSIYAHNNGSLTVGASATMTITGSVADDSNTWGYSCGFNIGDSTLTVNGGLIFLNGYYINLNRSNLTVNGSLTANNSSHIFLYGSNLTVNGSLTANDSLYLSLNDLEIWEGNIITAVIPSNITGTGIEELTKTRTYMPHQWIYSNGTWRIESAQAETFNGLKDAFADGVNQITIPENTTITIPSGESLGMIDGKSYALVINANSKITGDAVELQGILNKNYYVEYIYWYWGEDSEFKWTPTYARVTTGADLKNAINSGIRTVYYNNWNDSDSKINNLTIPDGLRVEVYGNLTITGNLSISGNGTLDAATGARLTISADATVSINGTGISELLAGYTYVYRGGGLWQAESQVGSIEPDEEEEEETGLKKFSNSLVTEDEIEPEDDVENAAEPDDENTAETEDESANEADDETTYETDNETSSEADDENANETDDETTTGPEEDDEI